MPRYITLGEFTQEGIANPVRISNEILGLERLADDHEGEIGNVDATLGRYDLVITSEFPDDESYTAFALSLASEGNLATETLNAIPEEQFTDLLAGLMPPGEVPTGEQ